LVDACASGAYVLTDVEVQVLSRVQPKSLKPCKYYICRALFFYGANISTNKL